MLSCQILTCKSLNLLISELASCPAFPLHAHLHITIWFWVRVFFNSIGGLTTEMSLCGFVLLRIDVGRAGKWF